MKTSRAPSNVSTSFSLVIKALWQRFSVWLTKGRELQVWKKLDRQGNTSWHAYDPLTGRSICVASDAEMREWIEQCYYS